MATTRKTNAVIHFTRARLDALRCPKDADRLVVYDDTANGLGYRVMAGGKRVFFWYGKVDGAPMRRNIDNDAIRSQPKDVLKGLNLDPETDMTVDKARIMAHYFAAHRPKPVDTVPTDDLTIKQAFDTALAATKRGSMATRDWNAATKRFLGWKDKAYPRLKLWKDTTRPVFKAYLATREGVSATRQRLDMQPIIQTARYMLREHNLPNLCDGLGIGSKLDRTPRPVYVKDVLSFLDFLRDHAPHIEVGAALQGLAGLQLLEALRLTWDKVNLKDGLVEISGDVKNEYRNRVIPVCGRVLEALRRVYPANRPDRLSMQVVLSADGKPFLGGAWFNYGKIFTRLMRGTSPERKEPKNAKKARSRAAKPKDADAPKLSILPNLGDPWNKDCEWQPKDLRNCLPTLAATEGVLGVVWEQYIGHAARGVSARHYIPRLTAATAGEKDALKQAMDVFRRLVVEVVETAIERAKAAPAEVVEVATAAGRAF